MTEKRPVPDHIPRPDYADHPLGKSLSEEKERGNTTIKILSDEEIEGMRVACKMGRQCLDAAARACEVGVTTEEIDRVVHETAVDLECYPSPLNYYNFPKSCCTSVNEVFDSTHPTNKSNENYIIPISRSFAMASQICEN